MKTKPSTLRAMGLGCEGRDEDARREWLRCARQEIDVLLRTRRLPRDAIRRHIGEAIACLILAWGWRPKDDVRRIVAEILGPS